jgi:hypothetical protein
MTVHLTSIVEVHGWTLIIVSKVFCGLSLVFVVPAHNAIIKLN